MDFLVRNDGIGGSNPSCGTTPLQLQIILSRTRAHVRRSRERIVQAKLPRRH
jgi:hypothetical protein